MRTYIIIIIHIIIILHIIYTLNICDFLIKFFILKLLKFVESAIDEVNLDANFYESEIFANGDFKIFWRILQVSNNLNLYKYIYVLFYTSDTCISKLQKPLMNL